MKYIITESQYRILNESEDDYSLQLRRRHNILKNLIDEMMPNIDFYYYETPEEFLDGVIEIVLNYMDDEEINFPYFKDIPGWYIRNYIEDNFSDIIMDYYNS